jgi:ornithine carbamoyltransferase
LKKQLQQKAKENAQATTSTTTTKEEGNRSGEYHESVINDVYNSMSDSEEEDEEVAQSQLTEQISTEAKAKEEEIKRQKEAALPITQKISHSLIESVNKVHRAVVEGASKENIKGVNDKVRGMFG